MQALTHAFFDSVHASTLHYPFLSSLAFRHHSGDPTLPGVQPACCLSYASTETKSLFGSSLTLSAQPANTFICPCPIRSSAVLPNPWEEMVEKLSQELDGLF